MKVVILAGGHGTRLSEETQGPQAIPKPMSEVGGMPILVHIMKTFSAFGHNDFIICMGYRAEVIRNYFKQLYRDPLMLASDVTYDFERDEATVHRSLREPWKVTLVDTGLDTMTGGRIKRIQPYVGDATFMCTYGDGLSDIDLKALLAMHRRMKRYATVTSVQPGGRFGMLEAKDNLVEKFREKHKDDGAVINGGYMVLEPEVFDYIDGDSTIFEQDPFEKLVADGQMATYFHAGFWQCMDSLRDKHLLEDHWSRGAPWAMQWNKPMTLKRAAPRRKATANGVAVSA